MPHSPRRGFTLVEMLVVITIIGILAAMLLPAINRAIIAARNAAIAIEVNQLATAIESYKQDKGDYPPNFRDSTVVIRHIRKCYPKADPTYISNFITYACDASKPVFIDEGESLVFWLTMTDTDPRYPFLSYFTPNITPLPVASPKKYYDFDESTLVPINTAEVQSVASVGNFNDVRAHYAKSCKETCHIYIDSRSYVNRSQFSQAPYNETASYASAEGTIGPRPYWSTAATGTGTTTRDKFKPVNPTTFQIICAGMDGEFFSGSLAADVKIFPAGNLYDDEDNDNITNFSSGKILKDNIPN